MGGETALDIVPEGQTRAAGSSCQRICLSPQEYSSNLGASARWTIVSVTTGVDAPTLVSLTLAPVLPRFQSFKRRPLAQVNGIGDRLPNFFRRMTQFPDNDERPALPVLQDLRPAGWTRGVCLSRGH
jgi:hypothetical protein